MNRSPVLLAAVTALTVGVLAGCSHASPAGPGGPAASPAPVVRTSAPATATPTASPTTASSQLGCDDLLTDAQVLAAAHGPHSPANRTVSATSTAGGTLTAETAVLGAGGLSCSWRVGAEGGAPADDVVVTAAVLPGAAKDWSAQLFGDAPTAKRRTFAGISAAAACADPGCGASAAVGSSWVRVDLLVTGLGEGTSVFAGETEDGVFANARPAIAAVFTAVQEATAAQLRFPSHVGRGAADCRNFLKPGPLAAAMGVRSASYAEPRYPDGVSDSLAGAAEHRVGVSSCFVNGSGTGPNSTAEITIAPDQAWAVAAMAADPDARGPLKPVALANQVAGEHALTDCTGSANECSVVFSLGTTAIQVDDGIRSKQIAEAIIAQAR